MTFIIWIEEFRFHTFWFVPCFQLRLENMKAGRKGNLNVATEVHDNAIELIWYITVKSCTFYWPLPLIRYFKLHLLFIWLRWEKPKGTHWNSTRYPLFFWFSFVYVFMLLPVERIYHANHICWAIPHNKVSFRIGDHSIGDIPMWLWISESYRAWYWYWIMDACLFIYLFLSFSLLWWFYIGYWLFIL